MDFRTHYLFCFKLTREKADKWIEREGERERERFKNCDFDIFFQTYGDRYYLNGKIKIPKNIIDSLKGMNKNYITSVKDCDYRYISILLNCVFTKEEMEKGCVQMSKSSQTPFSHLDEEKFEFMKGM